MDFTKKDNDNFKLFFDLREKKEYDKAISILKKLNKKIKNNSVISGLLGFAFFEIASYKKSKYYFRKTTMLNENSELASLGLFHTLNILGSEMLALKELDRFVKTSKPVKYKKTILDLKKSIKNSSNQRRNKLISQILLKASNAGSEPFIT